MFCISYDDDGEYTYQSMLRLGSGFKENDLDELSSALREYCIEVPPPYYQYSNIKKTLLPDVWFRPHFVWEVKCADLTLSPDHQTCVGRLHPSSGISGRFPRFICVRKDKNVTDATTAEQVEQMYLSQSVVKNQQKGAKYSSMDE
uniref:DNA ligase 1 n=1 Tax=Lygus hesperus TaxID=30085 RepID=A0A0A9XG50_LYGHE